MSFTNSHIFTTFIQIYGDWHNKLLTKTYAHNKIYKMPHLHTVTQSDAHALARTKRSHKTGKINETYVQNTQSKNT